MVILVVVLLKFLVRSQVVNNFGVACDCGGAKSCGKGFLCAENAIDPYYAQNLVSRLMNYLLQPDSGEQALKLWMS